MSRRRKLINVKRAKRTHHFRGRISWERGSPRSGSEEEAPASSAVRTSLSACSKGLLSCWKCPEVVEDTQAGRCPRVLSHSMGSAAQVACTFCPRPVVLHTARLETPLPVLNVSNLVLKWFPEWRPIWFRRSLNCTWARRQCSIPKTRELIRRLQQETSHMVSIAAWSSAEAEHDPILALFCDLTTREKEKIYRTNKRPNALQTRLNNKEKDFVALWKLESLEHVLMSSQDTN